MTAPLVNVVTLDVQAVGTAGNDATTVIGEAPFAGVITGVAYVPAAAITGAATNNRAVSLVNKGQAGSGTTVPATLAFVNAVNAAAFDEKAIPLSSTAADLVVAAGDVFAWTSVHVLTGITDPGGVVRVTISRS